MPSLGLLYNATVKKRIRAKKRVFIVVMEIFQIISVFLIPSI